MDHQGTVSEYELQRIKNIERNNQYLQKLGIKTNHRDRNTTTRLKSKPLKRKNEFIQEDLEEIPRRRSARVASLPVVSYKEVKQSSQVLTCMLNDSLGENHYRNGYRAI